MVMVVPVGRWSVATVAIILVATTMTFAAGRNFSERAACYPLDLSAKKITIVNNNNNYVSICISRNGGFRGKLHNLCHISATILDSH